MLPRALRAFRAGLIFVSPKRWVQHLVFWGGALAVGIIASLFALAADYANELFLTMRNGRAWIPFLVTPAGLALSAYLARRFCPGAIGSGIPQTIAALGTRDEAARGTLVSIRIAVGKVILTLMGLLSGASIGREGPTVQIGASIMQALGRRVTFSRLDRERGVLILAGGAAGISAAFNTPLAGIVFAIEELSRSYEHRTSGVTLTAVVFAGITAVATLVTPK